MRTELVQGTIREILGELKGSDLVFSHQTRLHFQCAVSGRRDTKVSIPCNRMTFSQDIDLRSYK